MKDPAFLFYYQDFLVGTDEFTNEETGAYIRCLCHQAHKGFITEKHMKIICFSQEIQNSIKTKFIFDEKLNGLVNLRLKSEIEKRQKYTESRSNNRKGKVKEKNHMKNISKTYDIHMENENENENVIKDKKEKTKIDFSIFLDSELPIIKSWFDYRKSIKKPLTQAALALIKKDIEKHGLSEIKNAIENSIKNGWQGPFPNKTNGKKIDYTPSGADIMNNPNRLKFS